MPRSLIETGHFEWVRLTQVAICWAGGLKSKAGIAKSASGD